MSERVTGLVERYRRIAAENMRGLPIVNPVLDVEAVGFKTVDGHEVGVLIAPWFMNLVVLPATEAWDDRAEGAVVEWPLPSGNYEMTVCRDEALGTYLTAVLFRTVSDFPDQDMARDVAAEIAGALDRPPDSDGGTGRRLSRRALFTDLGAS